MKTGIFYLLLLLELLGAVNASYLTYEHYANIVPPCPIYVSFINCGRVLESPYSTVLGIPIALFGVLYFITLFVITPLAFLNTKSYWKLIIIALDTSGAIVSSFLMYLQIFIVKSICTYCTLSALICFVLFGITLFEFKKERREIYSFIAQLLSKLSKNKLP